MFHETITENNVNVFENLPEKVRSQLEEYVVGPTWLKPSPFGFSIEIRDTDEMHNGAETRKRLYPSGELNMYLSTP